MTVPSIQRYVSVPQERMNWRWNGWSCEWRIMYAVWVRLERMWFASVIRSPRSPQSLNCINVASALPAPFCFMQRTKSSWGNVTPRVSCLSLKFSHYGRIRAQDRTRNESAYGHATLPNQQPLLPSCPTQRRLYHGLGFTDWLSLNSCFSTFGLLNSATIWVVLQVLYFLDSACCAN